MPASITSYTTGSIGLHCNKLGFIGIHIFTTPRRNRRADTCCQSLHNAHSLPIHFRCWYTSPSLTKSIARQQQLSTAARRRQTDDDYVELDDEDRWGPQANRSLSMVPSLARPIMLGANTLGNKLTDIAVELVPEHIDRGTVEFAVKTGLVLLAAAIARSLLGVALTVGTVVFGLYVAAKLYTKQEPEQEPFRPSSPQPSRRGRKPKQQSRDDDGLSDVWFEDKPKAKRKSRKTQTKQSDDTSW